MCVSSDNSFPSVVLEPTQAPEGALLLPIKIPLKNSLSFLFFPALPLLFVLATLNSSHTHKYTHFKLSQIQDALLFSTFFDIKKETTAKGHNVKYIVKELFL